MQYNNFYVTLRLLAPKRGILNKDHGHIKIECFSNANWVGSKEDKRSTFGYCVLLQEIWFHGRVKSKT